MSSSALRKKTASRCTTEAARGEHVFEIVGYNLMRGLGVGNFVRSRTFSIGGYDWFLLRTELEKDYVRDDCLTIECNLAVPMEAHLSDIGVSYEIDVPSCDIPEHFAELLDEKKKVGHVTIEDMEPDVFKALLRFFYTGSIHGMGDDLDGDDYEDILWHLLAAADRYDVDRLNLMCQSILSKNLSMENVATTLALADHRNSMAGVAQEGSQFDAKQYNSKTQELLTEDFFTSYDEVIPEDLLRRIYSYGFEDTTKQAGSQK
nr:unnamed protein product [Digitaria exilis]